MALRLVLHGKLIKEVLYMRTTKNKKMLENFDIL